MELIKGTYSMEKELFYSLVLALYLTPVLAQEAGHIHRTHMNVSSVDEKYGFRHFFSRAPNGVLVEFVEAKPWPEAAWE